MKLLPFAVVTALFSGALMVAAPAQAAPDPIHLDGVKVKVRDHTRQVVTVNKTDDYHARVTFWAKAKGEWVKRFQATDGRIGYNGLVRPRKRVQGSGKTPAGTFRLPWALGMAKQHDGSERLKDYPNQYEWAVVTSFNRTQVKHRGGAIFLHVNGSGATAGCASAPRWFLRKLMFRLDQDSSPLIAIGS